MSKTRSLESEENLANFYSIFQCMKQKLFQTKTRQILLLNGLPIFKLLSKKLCLLTSPLLRKQKGHSMCVG